MIRYLTYAFIAHISKPGLMDFISRVQPDLYVFAITPNDEVYGMIMTDELMEYFTNEFGVKHLEHVATNQIITATQTYGCKICGSRELLDLSNF